MTRVIAGGLVANGGSKEQLMRRTFIQLAIVTTALAVVGPALASSRASTPRAPEAAPSGEPTAAAAQAAGLCGLTQSDVADIVDHYDLVPNGPAFQAALQVPFDCDAYGGLCSALGTQDAQAYACGVWTALHNHQPLTQIRMTAIDRLWSWGVDCPTDTEECEEACDPYAVTHCKGIWVSGECKYLALCDFYEAVEIMFFEPILVFQP